MSINILLNLGFTYLMQHNSVPTLVYFNNSGRKIPETAIFSHSSYTKVFLHDNSDFQRVEFVDDNVITGIEYFLSSEENYAEIFSQFSSFDTITFYQNKIASGKYAQYEVVTVNRRGNIMAKRIQVLGDNLLSVYDRAIDFITNKTIYFAKHFHDLKTGISLEFNYDEASGNLSRITVYDPGNIIDTEEEIIRPENIGKGKNPYDFDWKGFDYYRFANPVLPAVDLPQFLP